MNTERIDKIDRNVCKDIRSELDTELASIGERLGISLRAGRCSYSNDSATFKLEVELQFEGSTIVAITNWRLNSCQQQVGRYRRRKGISTRTTNSWAYLRNGLEPSSKTLRLGNYTTYVDTRCAHRSVPSSLRQWMDSIHS